MRAREYQTKAQNLAQRKYPRRHGDTKSSNRNKLQTDLQAFSNRKQQSKSHIQ